jgi:hypothetical protein
VKEALAIVLTDLGTRAKSAGAAQPSCSCAAVKSSCVCSCECKKQLCVHTVQQ